MKTWEIDIAGDIFEQHDDCSLLVAHVSQKDGRRTRMILSAPIMFDLLLNFMELNVLELEERINDVINYVGGTD